MSAQQGSTRRRTLPDRKLKGRPTAQTSPDLQSLKFISVQSVATGLRQQKITSRNYAKLIPKAMKLGPKKGRMVVKGLLRATPNLQDRLQILTSIRRTRNPKLRREVVRAYRETGADMELITGLSLMTVRDATNFFKPYFAAGGTTKDVAEWLYNISARYKLEKQKGRVNPKYSGFWSDVWDAVTGTVSSIAEAIATVVDAVIEAGKAFGEIVSDIVEYTQNRINAIVEALLDAGREIGEFIVGAIEAGKRFVRKVFKAILAAGIALGELLKTLFEEAVDFVRDGIELLVDIGVRIRDLLKEALDLALDILKDVVGFLVDLGHSVWYIMKWAVKKTLIVVKGVVERLIELGKTIGDIILWFGRRTLGLVKKGFQVLFSLGYTFGVILHTLITDPRHLIEKGFKALKELGKTAYDFFSAVVEFGVDFIKKVYQTLVSIGMSLIDMLVFAASEGASVFKEMVRWLLQAGVKVFEILLWAAERSFQIFSWAMEIVDAVFESFFDIIEWAARLGGPIIQRLAKWLADVGRDALDWFETKVIEPLLAAGKLIYVIKLALETIVFLAVAYVVLESLADPDATDYKHWPSALGQFKTSMGSKLIDLPDVDSDHKYVLISDMHMESQDDIDSGLGHFNKNSHIFDNLMNRYSEDPTWTILSVGDEQEFWYNSDLTYFSSKEKVDRIVETYDDLFQRLANDFYKHKSPRRYIKMRGNHDDIYSDHQAVNRFSDHGFPNISVYDFATIRRQGKTILIMHGQQFDPYNCDANNFFGKFVSNFVSEPLDELNDTLVDIFGEGARIEGWPLAPYFKKSEWTDLIDDDVANPEISSDIMYDEQLIVDQIRKYNCSLIIGHTHSPKLMKDSEDEDRFYANLGTSGWWEGCVWTMEITPDDITLNAWTADSDTEPFRSFKLSEASATFE